MSGVFDRIAIAGVIKPGETYVIIKEDKESEEVTFFHAICDEEGLIAALHLNLHILYGKKLEMRRILGVKSLVKDRHIIQLLCFDKNEEKGITLEFILVRLLPVGELFARVMGTLGLEWEGLE
jgi:hypothetical protein